MKRKKTLRVKKGAPRCIWCLRRLYRCCGGCGAGELSKGGQSWPGCASLRLAAVLTGGGFGGHTAEIGPELEKTPRYKSVEEIDPFEEIIFVLFILRTQVSRTS